MKIFIFPLACFLFFCSRPNHQITGLDATNLKLSIKGKKEFRIAFGSCLDQDKPMPIWKAIKQKEPNLMLLIGDNVYGDSNSPGLPELKKAYFKQQENLNSKKINFPIWAIWDDHDYGLNDGGAMFPYKKEAEELFLKFFNVPEKDPRHKRKGLYYKESVQIASHKINFLFLDTRSFRGPLKQTDSPREAGKERYVPAPKFQSSMLGKDQWSWLKEKLIEKVDLVILISSIQVIAEGHGFERWGLLPREQLKLYNLLSFSGAKEIIAISGDRHRAGIYRKKIQNDKELWELTSSSLNKPSNHAEEPGPYRLGATYQKENFGLIKVNNQTKKISLQIHNKTGQKVLVEEINW